MNPSPTLHPLASASAPPVWTGEQIVPPWPATEEVDGGFLDFEGERFYRITHFDRLPPFLMTVVSAHDHWLFVSSTGGLTAGRSSVDRALFPYQAVDRIHDSAAASGPFTIALVTRGDRTHLWEPFTAAGRLLYRLSRHLYKSVCGHRLYFEEVNHDLGVAFRAEWTTSDQFGFVRRVRFMNEGFGDAHVRIIDGLRNLLPAGMPRRLIDEMSCLTDAYKRSELIAHSTLAAYALSSGITDQPVALESLIASVAWCHGLTGGQVLLSERQVDAFRQGAVPRTEREARGVRGVYAVSTEFALEAGAAQCWMLVAEQGLTQPQVVALAERVQRDDVGTAVAADVEAGAARLRAIVGGADGLQSGGDETATTHHFANVLFNVMRGGACLRGYEIRRADFTRFVEERNREAFRRHAGWLAALPEALPCRALGRLAAESREADLERLFLEYLPLGFSRRHGDPSRPWNRFSIRLRDAAGQEAFEYEGNWRDIFQNWEALGLAFPEFLGSMVAKFVNASTLDGYNPYRVTRRGIEWEVPVPDDPWAGIGYWGDHQVVYLLKLLEATERFVPGRLEAWLDHAVFSSAAVPYRITDYETMRRDPRTTITFRAEADAAIRARELTEGSDARLVPDPAGGVLHVTLAEKLLIIVLVRLSNLIPGGGIWMNTQRPEWNDANNALVGFGVSGVTLFYLRRLLVFCRRLFAGGLTRPVAVSAAVVDFVGSILAALHGAAGREEEVAGNPRARRGMVDQLARAGSHYRERIYTEGPGPKVAMPGTTLMALVETALPLVDATLRSLRRPDGLFHAYRLLHFATPRTLTLDDLPLMLEGQVAALGSGWLEPEEAVAVCRALRGSRLYQSDRDSYLLYPDANPPGFLIRNVVPEDRVAATPLLGALLAAGDARLVTRDARGVVRFHHDLVNVAALDERLSVLARDSRWTEMVRVEKAAVGAAYEQVFDHRTFTGRSGTMFAYEGLGSVYWHMVSKLLLAVQECYENADTRDCPAAAALAQAYLEIRAGLGYHKSPAAWGAFPTDPYSHTPAHAGAQQPGMTGQVKEGIIARWGELGLRIERGCIQFAPRLFEAAEFSVSHHEFSWVDPAGVGQKVTLPARTFAFTFCGTLVVYALVEGADCVATVTDRSGQLRTFTPARLPPEVSAAIFERSGLMERIEVQVGRHLLFR